MAFDLLSQWLVLKAAKRSPTPNFTKSCIQSALLVSNAAEQNHDG
ncbi:hypothetical protein TRICHSKD4_4098 [Roseibium sp. TrichSKD4]|nr:hypothetical protein TRICHSKD4_4098 [Roseibium sp. TrichSKD4]